MRASRRLSGVATLAIVLGTAACAPTSQSVDVVDSPAPAATVSSTWTPQPTSTPSATATPTLHPLSIAAMRLREYPGSEVVIEETLPSGSNYDQAIASYRSEGLKIYALLTVPRGEPPETGWPVIVFNHGYIPPEQYRTTERYVAYVSNLARSGYIVFRPDYRGHGESEGLPSGAYGSPDYVIDVLNAVSSMRRFSGADPDRIGMWGHSMGGYITLRAMVIDPGIRSGVIWAGVVGSYPDLFNNWRRTSTGTPRPPRGWRASLLETYGVPSDNPAFWDSISANAFLGDLSGPIQLHHGTGDASVPYRFSEALYEAIVAAGGSAELYLYEGADHNLSGPFTAAMQRTIEFYNRTLKGE